MNNKHFVKLTPQQAFFFGQENKYRKERGLSEIKADYFQQSAYFPQQTALLGTLRYLVLQKNGQIPINNTELATNLIGEKSFQAQKEAQKGGQNLGKIKNLSALFILDEAGNQYFQNPKDLILKANKVEKLKKSESKIETSLGDIHYFTNYNEKDGLSNFLYNSENNFLPYDYDKETAKDGVFIKQEKIGITKNERNQQGKREKAEQSKAKEEGFYKQIFYSLRKGFSFGFYAEIDDDNLDQKSFFVGIGAEKSQFLMKFQKCETEPKPEIEQDKIESESNKITLISDAYISNFNKEDFKFAIFQTKTFRFLKTEVKAGHKYYSSDPLKNANSNITRSKKFNLIEKGSVFFFENEDEKKAFAKKLKTEKNFRQIGYNNFI